MILGVIQRHSSWSRHENPLVSLDKGQQCLVAKSIFLPVGSVEVTCILPSTLTDLQLLSRYLLVIIFAFCSSENTQLFTSQFHYVLVQLCLMQKLTPCVSDFAANIDTISISAKVGMRTGWAYTSRQSDYLKSF